MRTPGARLVLDLDENDYHRMPGLSATSMKWLLRSPMHYRERVDHRVEKSSFDLGHAVHAKVLGVGLPIVAIPDSLLASNGAASTKAAKEFIEQARADGAVPMKSGEFWRIDAIANRVLANPKAAALFELPGPSEVSAFATDPESGVDLRGRLDRLGNLPDGRLVNIDLKSTSDVRRHKLTRCIEDFAYDIQSEVYRHLVTLATGADVAPTHLVFVEVDAPYEVRVVQLSHPDWITVGRQKMRQAIDIYARCVRLNQWPGDDDHEGEPEALTPRPYYFEAALDDMEVTL